MNDIVIRPATPADLPAITAIYTDAVQFGTASFELDPPDQVEMATRMQTLVAGGFPYLVATRENELLGYAYAGPYHTRPAFRFTVEDSIYLASSVQRQGVGRLLLAALIETSERRGFRQMVAVIGDSTHAASIALHRNAGFRMTGTIADVGYKFDRWLDCVIMQRALGEGANSTPSA